LSYVSDNSDPKNPVIKPFVNGQEFTLGSSTNIALLDYAIPAGNYQVEQTDNGDVWYHGSDGKYYLASVKDAGILSAIKSNSEYSKKISGGMENTDLSFVNAKPGQTFDYSADMDVNASFTLPEDITWSETADGQGFLTAKPGDITYKVKSSAGSMPRGTLSVVAKKDNRILLKDGMGRYWFGYAGKDNLAMWDMSSLSDKDKETNSSIFGLDLTTLS
jgi:hypothetical protein